jgi:hypothetical protein
MFEMLKQLRWTGHIACNSTNHLCTHLWVRIDVGSLLSNDTTHRHMIGHVISFVNETAIEYQVNKTFTDKSVIVQFNEHVFHWLKFRLVVIRWLFCIHDWRVVYRKLYKAKFELVMCYFHINSLSNIDSQGREKNPIGIFLFRYSYTSKQVTLIFVFLRELKYRSSLRLSC